MGASSRPSRSGAGSLGRGRSAALSAVGASSRPSRSGAGSRAGGEALPTPPQAQAPVLREAEQVAPGRGRSPAHTAAGASSRPSRSGAGSSGRGRSAARNGRP
ncbi:hypothetical protein [Paenibacillus illinoisensis]|uniref:hypothetical protein n=1 Tax=Paenibacillus illinoisensis TaxID=59845 RepID=UPI001C8EFC6C|nr:hypothetical protein [Paenibacillus illinoisensis]MBY0218481.1 hypothetical protein [Paenibacillus illinoisensis]